MTKEVPANREELLYKFNRIAKAEIKKSKGTTESLVEAIAAECVNAVPAAAFDPFQPFDEGILFFHGNVDESEVVEFQHDLTRCHLNLDPETPITLNLSSPGGSVYAGLALMSTISELQRKGRVVNGHVQGIAASMGSIIIQVCNRRTIEESSTLMLHEISYGMRGSTADHEEERAATIQLQKKLFGYYSRRTGKPVEYYESKLKKVNWYMDAATALAEGLVDEIIPLPRFDGTNPIAQAPIVDAPAGKPKRVRAPRK